MTPLSQFCPFLRYQFPGERVGDGAAFCSPLQLQQLRWILPCKPCESPWVKTGVANGSQSRMDHSRDAGPVALPAESGKGAKMRALGPSRRTSGTPNASP
mmetsp:Transcript_39869/g.94705  ORF Transcript_39869/g.94705 Transcript_39869/m.94705 type:complete len:100 (+) Transcript_39869:311-610(+)